MEPKRHTSLITYIPNNSDKIVLGQDEILKLNVFCDMDMNYEDGLLYYNDNPETIKKLSVDKLKKIMAGKGIRPPVSALKKNELVELLVDRIKFSLEKNEPAEEEIEGIYRLRDGRYLAEVDNFPLIITSNKNNAVLTRDIAVSFLDGHQDRCVHKHNFTIEKLKTLGDINPITFRLLCNISQKVLVE